MSSVDTIHHMKTESLSEAHITLHWNLSKEAITLGGALTLRAECEMLSKVSGQESFKIFVTPGDNSLQAITAIYEVAFRTSSTSFELTTNRNEDRFYPDYYFPETRDLFSFSSERIATLFKLFGIQPQLLWSKDVYSDAQKITTSLKQRFICLSLKFSGSGEENGDANFKIWDDVVKNCLKDLDLPIVIIGNDSTPQGFLENYPVRFLVREGIDLATQIAFSEKASLYIGTASGMASAVTFSSTPYLLYKHPKYHSDLMDRELIGNGKLPWANEQQRIIRTIPTTNEILNSMQTLLNQS